MDAQAAICKLCRFDLRCWCLVLQLNPECSQFDKSDFSRGEPGKHLFVDPDCGKHAPEPGQVSWWVIVCGWQLRMWSGASFFLRTKTQFSFLGRVKKEGYWLINVDQSFFFRVFGCHGWRVIPGAFWYLGGRIGRWKLAGPELGEGTEGTERSKWIHWIQFWIQMMYKDDQRCTKTARSTNLRRNMKKPSLSTRRIGFACMHCIDYACNILQSLLGKE